MSNSSLMAMLLLLLALASPSSKLAIHDGDLLEFDPNNVCRFEPHEDIPMFNVATATADDFLHVLPEQTGEPAKPCVSSSLVPLQLRGLDDDDKIALALTADTLEVAAFANGERRWHAFKNWSHQFPGAAVLRFGNDYASLVGDYAADLRISRASILQAIKMVAEYEQGPPRDDWYISRALATLRVAIPEAKRFTGIRDSLLSGWEDGTSVDEQQVKYLASWERTLWALLGVEKEGADAMDLEKERSNPTSKQQALDMDVGDVLLPTSEGTCPV